MTPKRRVINLSWFFLCLCFSKSLLIKYVCSALKIGVESLYVHVMCFGSYNGKCVCVSKKGNFIVAERFAAPLFTLSWYSVQGCLQLIF